MQFRDRIRTHLRKQLQSLLAFVHAIIQEKNLIFHNLALDSAQFPQHATFGLVAHLAE